MRLMSIDNAFHIILCRFTRIHGELGDVPCLLYNILYLESLGVALLRPEMLEKRIKFELEGGHGVLEIEIS